MFNQPSLNLKATHHEDGHERPLEESSQDVAPVVFVIGHPGQAGVHRRSDQEELDGGPQQPCPFCPEASLQVELGHKQSCHQSQQERGRREINNPSLSEVDGTIASALSRESGHISDLEIIIKNNQV